MSSTLCPGPSKRALARAVIPLVLTAFAAACGGVRTFVADHPDRISTGELPGVEVSLGDSVQVFRQTSGLIWGGYVWGLFSEDSTTVRTSHSSLGRSVDAYVVGAAPGRARVLYGNRMGQADPETAAWFWVQVVGSNR